MRRKAREYALQVLYALDVNSFPAEEFLTMFWELHTTKPQIVDYSNRLVKGTLKRKKEIDVLISNHASHWKIDRMAVTDRNILRLATYELLAEPTVPFKVVMNEAIEIAKKYGTTDSATFINGVLDSIYQELQRASKESQPAMKS
jgi:N utilization substance protein B